MFLVSGTTYYNMVNQRINYHKEYKLLYKKNDLLIFSKDNYKEINTKNIKLLIWGGVYAVILPNGNYKKINDDYILYNYLNYNISNFERPIYNYLLGDYIGCLITKNNLIIFSTKYNRKDIFYRRDNESIILSNELNKIMFFEKTKYDQFAIVNFINVFGNYPPKKHTLYRNIKRLGVGERVEINKSGVNIKKDKHKIEEINNNFEDKHLTEYYNIINDAIHKRSSNTNNWVYFSGGWDSTLILRSLIEQKSRSKIKAVTADILLSSRIKDFNKMEVARAKRITDFYQVEHYIVPTPLDDQDYWNEIIPFLRQNQVYSFNSLIYFSLSKFLQKKIDKGDAIYSGEISDGVHSLGFSNLSTIINHNSLGFRRYADKMSQYLFSPTFYKKILDNTYKEDIVYQFFIFLYKNYKFDNEHTQMNLNERIFHYVMSFFASNKRIPFFSLDNLDYLTKSGRIHYKETLKQEYFYDIIRNLDENNFYGYFIDLYNNFHWQGSTIKSIYETAKYHNMSIKMPFGDSNLIKFLSKMPETWGRNLELNATKYPLKKILLDRLKVPSELMEDTRAYEYDINPNFSLTHELLYNSSLFPMFKKVISDFPYEEIINQEYFDIEYLRNIVKKYKSKKEVNGIELDILKKLILLCWIGWF